MNKFRGQNGYTNSSTNRHDNKPAANVVAPNPAASERKPDIRPTAQEVVDHANAKQQIKAPAASDPAVSTTAAPNAQTPRPDDNTNT